MLRNKLINHNASLLAFFNGQKFGRRDFSRLFFFMNSVFHRNAIKFNDKFLFKMQEKCEWEINYVSFWVGDVTRLHIFSSDSFKSDQNFVAPIFSLLLHFVYATNIKKTSHFCPMQKAIIKFTAKRKKSNKIFIYIEFCTESLIDLYLLTKWKIVKQQNFYFFCLFDGF